MVQFYTLGVSLFGIMMLVLYLVKYRRLSITSWKPGAAWTRAMIYFAICNLISIWTGTTEIMVSQPIASTDQLSDPLWIVLCILCYLYIFIAYWILWAKMTLTFDRKYYIGTGLVFGIIWGLSTGQVLLSFYHVWNMTEFPRWAVYLGSFACMALWQYIVHDYFWDIYVSPEHDTPKSIKLKTLVSHIPNVALCLLFLVLYENYWLFVFTQTFALIATTIFQKFPAPWAKGEFHAPMTKKGMFKLPRGAGFTKNYENVQK
ncbi:MAG: hypothetical protein ACTSRX_03960 [Promethearchaeota archaeon]